MQMEIQMEMEINKKKLSTGNRVRTYDLVVMSHARFLCAIPVKQSLYFGRADQVPAVGFDPTSSPL